jgi:hypothetical protein
VSLPAWPGTAILTIFFLLPFALIFHEKYARLRIFCSMYFVMHQILSPAYGYYFSMLVRNLIVTRFILARDISLADRHTANDCQTK